MNSVDTGWVTDEDPILLAARCAIFEVVPVDLSGARLVLGADRYLPGQRLVVSFEAPAGLADNAWVGVVPSSVEHGDEARNDAHDISYEYLRGRTEGELSLYAPPEGGRFDVRMHDSDSGGQEIAHVSFEVELVLEAVDLAAALEAEGSGRALRNPLRDRQRRAFLRVDRDPGDRRRAARIESITPSGGRRAHRRPGQ